MGYALYVAQRGGRHPNTKTLSGFGGGGRATPRRDMELIEQRLREAEQMAKGRE